MCGISIVIDNNNNNNNNNNKREKNNILEIVLDSLCQIQNRGYDSAGIGFLDNDSHLFEIYKYASTEREDSIDKLKSVIKNLDKTFKQDNISNNTNNISNNISNNIKNINTVIGHTRWATHGSKTDKNSHPHISQNNDIILVHNGIIENFQELKSFLQTKYYTFYSETDTEVICNLIEYYLDSNYDIEASIQKTQEDLKGTWGLGILYRVTGCLYLMRNGSPLLFGYNSDNKIAMCTSEISGFNNLVSNYKKLQNKTIYKVVDGQLQTLDDNTDNMDNNSPFIKIKKIFNESLGDYTYWMQKEIFEQDKSILRSLNNGGRIQNNQIKLGGLEKLCIKAIRHIIFLGAGTSYNAALIGKYYFEQIRLFETVQVYEASEFSEYNIPITGTSLVFFLSQSGETQDLYKNIAICKRHNCITLGIINVVDSLIATEVDCGVYLNAGREVSVASTKSFTSMITVLILIQLYFVENIKGVFNSTDIEELRILPRQVYKLLNNHDFLSKIENIKLKILENLIKTNSNSLFLLGKSKMYSIAREAALKIKEVAYIHAEAYSCYALKHGPLALITDDTVCILLIDRENKDIMLNTYQEVKARGGYSIIISDLDSSRDLVYSTRQEKNLMTLFIEQNKYSEILFTVVLQYLSYILSISKNINPDKPRNLAKVVTV